MACATGCGYIPSQIVLTCPKGYRKSGIPYFVVASCELAPTDDEIEDPDWWCAQMAEVDIPIAISPYLLGEKPESTFTDSIQGSCTPAEIDGETQLVTFSTTELDTNSTGARDVQYTDVDWFENTKLYQRQLIFGYIDCAGLFYGFNRDVQFRASLVIGNQTIMKQKWMGQMSWFGTQNKPFNIPNLVSILQGTGCP